MGRMRWERAGGGHEGVMKLCLLCPGGLPPHYDGLEGEGP